METTCKASRSAYCVWPGATLIERQVAQLAGAGINDIVLVKGYEAAQINVPGARVYLNPDYERTNMVHSLFRALEEINGDVLIAYADILYEERIIRELLASNHPITVARIAIGSAITTPAMATLSPKRRAWCWGRRIALSKSGLPLRLRTGCRGSISAW